MSYDPWDDPTLTPQQRAALRAAFEQHERQRRETEGWVERAMFVAMALSLRSPSRIRYRMPARRRLQ